ncbi:MAG: hypothetical protein LWW85_06530 [Marinilabiliales bacterium]|nr:hypothetical protein [Marinilabiliales bacterium]
MKKFTLFWILLCGISVYQSKAQFLMDMVDTTKMMGKGMLGVYQKYDHLKIGGYIQPQFQVTGDKGARSYEGGDFNSQENNRIMLRRSRIRVDYVYFGDVKKPGVQVVFQFDANERGFTVRDLWGRIFENNLKLFSFTTGMFARPFGFEINYSSSDRESPERGRMSQILMKGERDLGAMITFEPRRSLGIFTRIKADLGLFNGQGIYVSGDFDNYKDLIARISMKPVQLGKRMTISGGLSTLQGGLLQNTRYCYATLQKNGAYVVAVDSSAANLFGKSPRSYNGADIQLKIQNRMGSTEIRGEWIGGRQTGTAASSETPTALMTGRDGFYVRRFSGAYFYLVQNIFTSKNQLVFKYDWYDPNRLVKGKEIGAAGSNFSAADIRYDTFGMGYIRYMTENIKLMLYFARVQNEITALKGFTSDLKDNVMTCRIQFRF